MESNVHFERTCGLDVSAGKDHQAETLTVLYDAYYERIYAFSVRRLFCRTAAEDVASQIFLNAARRFHTCQDRTQEAFGRWVYAIAVNQCNGYLRKNLRRRELFKQFQREPRRQEESMKPNWPVVYGALSELKPVEQTVITLRFFEQMSYSDIAAIIDKRENTVRVILHRALKQLRKRLNPEACGFGQ